MKFVHSMKDVRALNASKEVVEHIKYQLEGICNILGTVRNVNDLDISSYASILAISNEMELNKLIETNTLPQYGQVKLFYLQKRLFKDRDIYIIGFLTSDSSKLIECVVDESIFLNSSIATSLVMKNRLTEAVSVKRKMSKKYKKELIN